MRKTGYPTAEMYDAESWDVRDGCPHGLRIRLSDSYSTTIALSDAALLQIVQAAAERGVRL